MLRRVRWQVVPGLAYTRTMNDLEILVPVAATRVEKRLLAPRLKQLNGARIAWLDNMKANASDLLFEIAASLQTSGARFERIALSKNATAAAPESVIAHLKNCDAVVLAIAD